MNIIEPILFQCRSNPPAAALCVPGKFFNVVSYARLERFIHNVGRKGEQLGLTAGNIVAIFISDAVLHVAVMLGLTRLGVITFSGRNPKLPKELRVDALITDSFFPYEAARIIRADRGWMEGDGNSLGQDKIRRGNIKDICRIVLTSGTTGDAKAVGLTHGIIAKRIGRHLTVLGTRLPQCARTYCELGFATSLGFQFLIYILWRGGTIFFPGDSMEFNLRAFDAYKVQNMISAPSNLAQYLRYFEGQKSLQCNLEMILSAGSLLSPSLSKRVQARICPNVFSLYGSTEASMVATAPAHAIADTVGAVGYVTPGISVEIVDQAENVLPAGQEGIVRIRSPYSADAYIGDPVESAKAFRDGWFYPGDIGRLTSENLLIIAGREKAVVNLGGDKVKPELVEEAIVSFASIEQAGVFSVVNDLGIEELWALIVSRAAWDERALRSHCESKLPHTFVPVRFIPVDSLPHNEMGKIERHLLWGIARDKLN